MAELIHIRRHLYFRLFGRAFGFSGRRIICYLHSLPARLGALAPFFYRDENGGYNAVFFVADKSGTRYLVAVMVERELGLVVFQRKEFRLPDYFRFDIRDYFHNPHFDDVLM
jgi:hypothetical protein